MAASALRKRPNPSLQDVIEAIAEVHDCLHTVDRKVDTVKEDVSHVRERVSFLEGQQVGIARRVGVPEDGSKPKTSLSMMGRWKATLLVFSAVFGAIVSGAAAYPVVRKVTTAVDQALTAPAAK